MVHRVQIAPIALAITQLLLVGSVFPLSGLKAQESGGILPNEITFTSDGVTTTYQVALDEYAHITPDGNSARVTIQGLPSASAMRQRALEVERTSGGRVWLAMYPAGKPKDIYNRHLLTEDLLLKLKEPADPNAVATALGLTYHGTLYYYPGMHLFRAGGAGASAFALEQAKQQPTVLEARPVFARSFVQRYFVPDDPLFTNQWHLLNTGQNGATPGSDVNITNVWERYRGSNTVIGIFDDGFDITHPDLIDNLLTNMAYNPIDGSQDVTPRPGDFHGTAVSGVAAARGNNSEGLSGAAPNASIVPIRFDFNVGMSPLQIAEGLLHSNDIVQVHNNSWGINTSFFLYELDPAESNAFYTANTFGRGGRGTIYVYSAGNDAQSGDDVNYSGFTKHMSTIAVAALNDLGRRASYSTYGAATVISAPAGLDSTRFQGTSTTDVQGTNGYNPTTTFPLGDYTNLNYTANFNGTSSAAPLTTGVIALILEANPNLGWRDVQEIVMRSASLTDTNHFDWITNAAGFHFNHEYGAGIINADAAVMLATNWTNLGLRTNISFTLTNLSDIIPDFDPAGVTKTFTVTNHDLRLEHVQLHVNASHISRGDLEITLTSPSGTESILARTHFDSNPDYDWTFYSVRNWGEFASGGSGNTNNQWSVTIRDQRPGASGFLSNLRLTLHGTITNSTTIGLTDPPSIIEHPTSRTITKGSTMKFRVVANSVATPSFRWLFTDPNGATTVINTNRSELQLTAIDFSRQGIYVAEVFNQFGVTRSAPATLFVNSPPEIAADGQPTNRVSVIGGNTAFSVAASGAGPLQYQWRRNSVPISGATSSILVLTNLQASDFSTNGTPVRYDVTVRNTLASIISNPATLAEAPGVTFTALPAGLTNGVFQFGFSGALNQNVRIDGSTNLTNWIMLDTRTLNGGNGVYSDPNAGTFPGYRYYRVVPIP